MLIWSNEEANKQISILIRPEHQTKHNFFEKISPNFPLPLKWQVICQLKTHLSKGSSFLHYAETR